VFHLLFLARDSSTASEIKIAGLGQAIASYLPIANLKDFTGVSPGISIRLGHLITNCKKKRLSTL